MRKCSKCGYESEDKWTCPECGEDLVEIEEIKEKTESKKSDMILKNYNSDAYQSEAPTGKDIKKGFFTSPINRKQFWLRTVLFIGGGALLGILLDMLVVIPTGVGYIYPHILPEGIAHICLIFFQVQRLHDANKTGLWALFNILAPIGGIIVSIVAGCLPPQHENNKWLSE